MDLDIFCDSLSTMGLLVGLKIAELCCNPPLCGSHHPPPSYISACGVDKKLSKMVGNLASYALWRG